MYDCVCNVCCVCIVWCCMWVCICVCVYVCLCVFMCVYVCICVYYVCVCMCVNVCLCVCVCVCIYTNTHTPINLRLMPTRWRSCLGVDLWLHWGNQGRPWCINGRHRSINLPNQAGRLSDIDWHWGRRPDINSQHQSIDCWPKLCATVIPSSKPFLSIFLRYPQVINILLKIQKKIECLCCQPTLSSVGLFLFILLVFWFT